MLLVTLDTTRADHLGPYGYPMARTPTLDALAAEGAVFERHFTTAPITLPAHISILSGLTPPAHGVRDNGAYALADEVTTLPELLGPQGYDTSAWISAVVLDSRYNLDQGFDVYDDDLWGQDDPALFMIRERPGVRTAEALVGWLKERPAGPFFAWMHLFDPHQPYHANTWDLVQAPTAYDAEIAGADRAVGLVVDALRELELLDDTLVIITADHGESLGEHGERTHAVFIYDATMHVPLILRWPGHVPAGVRVSEPTSAVDLVPTTLSLLGLPPQDTQGLDLSPLFSEGGSLPARGLYMESLLAERGFGMAPLYGLREGSEVWIRAPRPERYATAVDPGQLNNLHPGEPAPGEAIDGRLQAHLDRSEARAVDASANPMSTETREMLMAMGYLAPQEDREAVAGMDPKDGLRMHLLLEDARHAVRAADWLAAEGLLTELLEATPGNVSARNTLGYVYLQQGEDAAAEDQYLRSLADDPRQYRTLVQLAQLARRRGDIEQAKAYLNQALEVTPDYVEAMVALGVIAYHQGDEAAAEQWHQRALAVDPGAARLWRDLADLRYRQGKWAEALALYLRVTVANEGDFQAWLHAGAAALKLERPEEALRYDARAAALRPDSWIPPYNAACAQVALHKPEEAMASLARAVELGLSDPRQLLGDPDLAALHPREDWRALVEQVRAAKGQEREGAPL